MSKMGILITRQEAIDLVEKCLDEIKSLSSVEPKSKCAFKVGDEVEHQRTGEIAYVFIPEDERGNFVILMKGYACPQLTPTYHWFKTGHSNSIIRDMIHESKKAMEDEE